MKINIILVSIMFFVHAEQIPEYLAIVVQEEDVKSQITSFSYDGMMNLIKKYTQDMNLWNGLKELYDHTQGGETQWNDANPWHVTCLYIGENMTKLETPEYKSFVAGREISLFSPLFVYVPDKLMIAAILVDRDLIQIENDFPHITLFQNWPAVNSNFVLDALFNQNGPLRSLYPTKVLSDPKFEITELYRNITVLGELVDIYVSKNQQNLLNFTGLTQEMYALSKLE